MSATLRRAMSMALGLGVGLGVAATSVNAQTLEEVMKARGLTEKDVLAAAKTYTPTGGRDEYLAFATMAAPMPQLEQAMRVELAVDANFGDSWYNAR